jgi:predicted oxidoreductase
VRRFGVSNFSTHQYELLHARYPLVTNQIEWHPLRREPLVDGTLDQAQRLRAHPMIWSPLAGGALFTSDADDAVRVREALSRVGATHQVSAATVAFAWILRHPSRPHPITGSGRMDAMREAVAATSVRLDVQEWTEILVAASGREVP